MLRVPPLNPLKVFDVVARTSNLTAAANELGVSQSAVSRQIAVLEKYLGVQLFTRERLGVRLTDVGECYARQVGPAFDEIADATAAVTRRYSNNVVRLRTYTTLTARWLIPRLPHFKALHPEVEVAIINSSAPLNFATEQCDLAIVLGNGHWPDAEAVLLLEDIIEPVCAPGFVATNSTLAEALLGKHLLISKYRKDDWPRWLAHVGLSELFNTAEKMIFSSSILTWQAAVDELGIAIGQPHMLGPDFQAHRLVCPFGSPLRTGMGHYLVTPVLQRYSDKIAEFKSWLLAEAAGK